MRASYWHLRANDLVWLATRLRRAVGAGEGPVRVPVELTRTETGVSRARRMFHFANSKT